jgi:hypothetical protein
MVTGIAVLGVLAGSLASFFRLDRGEANGEPAAGQPARPASGDTASGDTASGDTASGDAASGDAALLQALAAEVAALRRQVEVLTERLTGAPPGPAQADPAPGGDAPG